jgi:hypothetical protein
MRAWLAYQQLPIPENWSSSWFLCLVIVAIIGYVANRLLKAAAMVSADDVLQRLSPVDNSEVRGAVLLL